eukprot:GILJ01006668.1.p1 GENE.GILJ01006668.1~~GILJ01006668.1.p1  ORF type:complete len:372 (+),score=44.51 GILJ01006668.1:67-1182(+)
MSAGVPQTNRPAGTDFKQQRLTAWQPVLTPFCVISTFVGIAAVLIPLGIMLVTTSLGVIEFVQRYDTSCHGATCDVNVRLEKDMKAPVYFYYQVENFYQNHRRYMKSRSDAQLAGGNVNSASDIADCDPMITDDDGKLLNPCGLVARSYFNDTFALTTMKGARINISENNIAWASDVAHKFKSVNQVPPPDINTTNEHFMVWMRASPMSPFRKLWGRIDTDLRADTYVLKVNNSWDVTTFKGAKSVVFSTTSFLGGRNPFLGIAYLVVGFAYLLLAIGFFVKWKGFGRVLGQLKDMAAKPFEMVRPKAHVELIQSRLPMDFDGIGIVDAASPPAVGTGIVDQNSSSSVKEKQVEKQSMLDDGAMRSDDFTL